MLIPTHNFLFVFEAHKQSWEMAAQGKLALAVPPSQLDSSEHFTQIITTKFRDSCEQMLSAISQKIVCSMQQTSCPETRPW